MGKINLWDIKLIIHPGLSHPLVQWVGTKWHICASRHLEWGGTILDLFLTEAKFLRTSTALAQGCPLPSPGSLWLLTCSCTYSQTYSLDPLVFRNTFSCLFFSSLFSSLTDYELEFLYRLTEFCTTLLYILFHCCEKCQCAIPYLLWQRKMTLLYCRCISRFGFVVK